MRRARFSPSSRCWRAAEWRASRRLEWIGSAGSKGSARCRQKASRTLQRGVSFRSFRVAAFWMAQARYRSASASRRERRVHCAALRATRKAQVRRLIIGKEAESASALRATRKARACRLACRSAAVRALILRLARVRSGQKRADSLFLLEHNRNDELVIGWFAPWFSERLRRASKNLEKLEKPRVFVHDHRNHIIALYAGCMEFGITIPLQRHLRLPRPAYGEVDDLAF